LASISVVLEKKTRGATPEYRVNTGHFAFPLVGSLAIRCEGS
jgi:hypothetical protein